MEKTNIEWCDSTVNPTTGCQGCELWAGQVRTCYAGQMHEKRLARAHPDLYAEEFTEVRLAPGRMAEAARWRDLRGTQRPGKPWLDGLPRTIFVGDMGDVFSADVPFDYLRDEVFAAIESPAGRRHIWMLLTKQPHRMRVVAESLGRWPENAWAGVSVTSQANVSRIEHLLAVPAPVRFVSAEPLVGPVDFRVKCPPECRPYLRDDRIGWVIVGGESGTGARPCKPEWIRDIVELCRDSEVPCFVKQLGSRVQDGLSTMRGHDHPTEPHFLRLKHDKGGDPSEWPDELVCRRFPRTESVLAGA